MTGAPVGPSRVRRMLLPVGVGLALSAQTLALRLRDPHVSGTWGYCPVFALTGLYCPGCGGLRAVNDLTHGRILDALGSNLFAVGLVLCGSAWLALWLLRSWQGRAMPRRGLPVWSVVGLVTALVLFTILRNLQIGAALTPTLVG